MNNLTWSKRTVSAAGLLAPLVLLLFAFAVQPAAAAAIVVNSAADDIDPLDGECTLREAIIAANTDTAPVGPIGECNGGSGPDAITFADNYTITLVGSQLPAVTTEMTITGNGAANTIIQASTCNPVTLPGGCTPADWRVLEAGTAGNLTLDGVTVRHGNCDGACSVVGESGGGILNNIGTLTVTNSTLSGNSAGRGGGISSVFGTATVTNSTLSGNSAGLGGGIYNNNGTLDATNSTLSGNSATNNGGGIYNIFGAATVTNSTLSGNSATNNGGGIRNISATLTVTNSTLTGNVAGDNGGGIDNRGALTVTDSTLSGNSATDGDGGGIDTDDGTLDVINSTLTDNSAGTSGGGIHSNDSGTVTVTNSTLSGNTAENIGGGIYNLGGTLAVANSTLLGNSAGDQGGGIFTCCVGTTTLTRSLISGNSAGTGAEVVNSGGTTTADAYNVFSHSGQSDATAFDGFAPGLNDFNATSDEQNVALANILNTTLADNGGPTETHALVPGSPAIDFGPTAGCAAAPVNGLDQRGEPRSIDIPGTGDDGGANLCDSGAYEVQLPVDNVCPVDDPGVGSELTTLLGTGMGSPTRSRMVARVVIPNAGDVTDLYGQMAAKEYSGVRYVRFIFGDKTYQQVPTDGGTFDLGQKAAISWWGDDLTAQFQSQNRPFVKGRWFLHKGMKKMKLPRAIVFYATRDTGEMEYANSWSTFTAPDNFVAGTPGFPQTNSNILPIPETQATTDIVVQLAITDVNRDARSVDVIITAGNASETVTLTSPTNKKSELLEILEVTLPNVPIGTDQVEIELVSVLDEGDSAALLGAAAAYECGDAVVAPETGSITVVKVVEDVFGPPQEPWEFTGTLGNFTLPGAGGQTVFDNLASGSYTITETPSFTWLTAVECDNNASGSNEVTFNLAAGEDVTCTFTNTENPQ